MKKGQRPSKHVRRVKTKKGKKKVVVNPSIRKRSRDKKDKKKFYLQEEGKKATPWSYDTDNLPIPRGGPMIDPRIPIVPDEEQLETFMQLLDEQKRMNKAAEEKAMSFEQEEKEALDTYERRLLNQLTKANRDLIAAQEEEKKREQERLKMQREAKLMAKDKIKFADIVANKIMDAKTQKDKYALYKKQWGSNKETISDIIANAELLAENSGRNDYIQRLKELKKNIDSQIEPTKLKIEKAKETKAFNIRQGERLKDYYSGKMPKTDAKFFELTLPKEDLDIVRFARQQMEDKSDVGELLVGKGVLNKDEAKELMRKVGSGDVSMQEFQAIILRAAMTPKDFKAMEEAGEKIDKESAKRVEKSLIDDTTTRELKEFNVNKPIYEAKRREVEARIKGGPAAIQKDIEAKKDALAYLRAEIKGTKKSKERIKDSPLNFPVPEEEKSKPVNRRPKSR